jgi:hypothetical protein
MGTAAPRPGRAVLIVAVVGLLLGFLYLAVAAPYLSSRDEEMMLGRFPVVVSYSDSASPDELMLPFYPASEMQESFAYSVATKEGEPVVQYASASLTTADSWEKVAEYYSSELPGQPEAEEIEDESGKRYVLVVSGEEEVRTVTLRPTEEGSRIELLRATPPKKPTRRIRPRRGESVI